MKPSVRKLTYPNTETLGEQLAATNLIRSQLFFLAAALAECCSALAEFGSALAESGSARAEFGSALSEIGSACDWPAACDWLAATLS